MQNRLIWRIAIDKRLAHNMLNNPEKSIPCINIHYLHQEVMFSPLSVCLLNYLSICLSLATIFQKVFDRFSCKFVEGLAIDQGPTQYVV